MDNQEMPMQELMEAVKVQAGFVGNIHYTEQEILRNTEPYQTITNHLHSGQKLGTASISMEMAYGFEDQMTESHVPYAVFDVRDEFGEKSKLYAFCDKDMPTVKGIICDLYLDLPDMFSKPRRAFRERDFYGELEPGM